MQNKPIAIIPARGGSKRIPRKNIKDFLGKPIISYSIQAALKSDLFDQVMVSTDDEEIAAVAKKYGAKVPFFRSKKNADDYASTYDVIKEVITAYQRLGKTFDYTCCLYPTAPFIKAHHLQQSFEFLKETQTEGVFCMTPFSYPIQRALFENEQGYVRMEQEAFLKTRSQDLKEYFHDIGFLYFYETEKYLTEKSVFKLKTKGIVLSNLEAQDIDTLDDWKIAELKYKYIHEIRKDQGK